MISQQLAQLQDKQIATVAKKSAPFVKRFASVVERAAIAALRQDKSVTFSAASVDIVAAELVGLSLLAYMRAVKEYREPTLQLSDYDKELAKYSKSLQVDVGILSKQLIKQAKPRVKQSLHTVKKRLNKAIGDLNSTTLSQEKKVKLLRQELDTMGVAPRSSGYLDALIHTHAEIAYGAALWDETQNDDSVWGYEYVDFGDDRVRPAHHRLNGVTRKKDDAIWGLIWPPNGWNCRCRVVPLRGKRRQTRIPSNIEIDEGFDFNPGLLLK